MNIKPTSTDYLSEIRNRLNENLDLYLKTYCEESDIDKFTEMIKFLLSTNHFQTSSLIIGISSLL